MVLPPPRFPFGRDLKQEQSARERTPCQMTECFCFVKVIMRGKHN